MSLSNDDPKLTAFALDELSPAERAEIESELRDSPELQTEMEEIRRAAKLLSVGLAGELLPRLTESQFEAIAAAGEPPNVIRLPRRNKTAWAALAALAASIAAIVLGQIWFTAPKPARQYAMQPVEQTVQPKSPVIGPAKPVVVAQTAPAQSRSQNEKIIVELEELKRLNQKAISQTGDDDRAKMLVHESPVTSQTPVIVLNAGTRQQPQPAQPPSQPVLLAVGGVDKDLPKNVNTTPIELENRSLSFAGAVANDNSAQNPTATLKQNAPVVIAKRWNRLDAEDGLNSSPHIYRFQGNDSGIIVVPRDNDSENLPYRYRRYRVVRPNPRPQPANTASYPHLADNPFAEVSQQPLSTFSADVDGASYANVRRFLDSNQLPPRDAVRIEEMINYFSYDYPQPRGEDPFSVNIEIAGCPWNADHRLARIGLKAREIAPSKRTAGNYVFLIDVSGSMEPAERLPLIKQALRHLVKKLGSQDRVAIVVYANEAGVKLPSTSCSEKEKILDAIDNLSADGSTNGGDGIQQAYRVARENFIRGGVNRVLLCTDGDFNVGITDPGELTRMIEDKARDGIFLTTLGVGTDNYKDALMQKLADKGNGNYYYLDSLEEAQRVLVDQMNSTLVTIAKDVKLQVEFNPAQVSAYRLIGYEKRALAKQDFNNDAKDAGEIGAGHTVTALYEIVPVGGDYPGAVDDLKYQPAQRPERHGDALSRESFTVKLRYKQPDGTRSHLLEFPATDSGANFAKASDDFKFASTVAAFGMLLRDSEYKGDSTFQGVEEFARESKGADETGYRSEFINLVRKAASLAGN